MSLYAQRSTRQILSICLALLACLLLTATARAQTETTGAVEGLVLDGQNNPVPGAVVQFYNPETQLTSAAKADAAGRFIKYQLLPGLYHVRVRMMGFRAFEKVQRVAIMGTRQVLPPIILETEVVVAASPTPIEPTVESPPVGGPPVPAASPATPPAVATGPVETDITDDSTIREEINTTDGRRGGSFPEREVSTLPLGAVTRIRTFDELALLLPGVALPPQTQGDVAGPGVGAGVGSAGQFSVNGLRSRANNFTIDGSDNNDEDIGVRRQGFLALVPQPVESIKEYNVITLLAPAQYGRNIGAQVNAVSMSGGNSYHGTFFGFFNSSQLNAPDFFDSVGVNTSTPLQGRALNPDGSLGAFRAVHINNQPAIVTNNAGGKDSFTLGQAGFAFGGPLVPRRPGSNRSLFYFVAAEGHILHATKEANFAVPTVEERGAFRTGASGLFFNPATCRTLFPAPTGCSSNPSLDFYYPTPLQSDSVFSLFPFPNNPTGIYGRNTLTQVLPASGESRIVSGKSTANFNAFNIPHQFTARYNFTDDFRDIPVTGNAIFSSLRPNVRTQNFSTFLNSTLSNTVSNEFRASYGRTRLNFEELRDPSLLPSDKLQNTPFLLNAPFLSNNTFPQCANGTAPPCPGSQIVASTGPVLYFRNGTIERGFNRGGGIADGALGPIGQLIIAGYSPVGVDVFNFPQRRVNNTYQIADTLTMGVGRHTFAFGTDIRRAELNSDLPRNSRTAITFNGAPRLRFPDSTNPNYRFSGFYGPADLAASRAASSVFTTLAAPGSSSNIGLRYYQLYFFGQDEWRVRNNLSLSYGVRYEYTTPPREVNRIIERTFNSSDVAQLLPNLNSFIDGRTGIFDPDRNNFAPRLGIAYSPRRSTVIRLGYGWFYDQIIGAVVSQSRNTFPSFLTLNTGGGLGGIQGDIFDIFNPAAPNNGIRFNNTNPRPGCGPFSQTDPRTFCPYTALGSLNNLNPGLLVRDVVNVNNSDFPGGFGITLPARDLSTPTAQHYSATIEQQLGNNTVISAAYVGTQGRHLLRFTTPNLGPNTILLPFTFDQTSLVPTLGGLTLPPGARVTADGSIVGGRPVSGVGAVNIFETSANSRYDALQIQVRGRFVRRLQYQANYTFSRAEDDASDVFDLAGSSALPQNSLVRAGERADSNFDARHRIAYNLIYTLPSFNNYNGAFRALFGGLELASTGQFQTGQPFTVNSIFDVNLDGNLTDRLDSTNGIIRTGDRRQPLRLQSGVDPTTLLAAIGQDGREPRNSFRASNLLLVNLAISKRFRITETQALTFRTEIFNLTNRANYGIPVRFLEAPGFGQATDTVTPGRRVQFALKYSF